MSDYTVEERLEGCRKGLLKNSICMGIGTVSSFAYLFAFGGGGPIALFLLIGIIWGFPVLKAFFFGGWGAAFTGPLKADYEVVTVDGAGNRISSDGGAQSIQTNFVMRIFMLAAVYCIAMVVVTFHVFYLSVKGLILTARAKVKPPFKKSVLFIVIINIAVYIGSSALLLGASLGRVAARKATIANLSGQTLTVFTPTLNLRAEPSGTSKVIKTLNTNDTITATGNISDFWVPVKMGNDNGYVLASSVNLNKNLLKSNVEFPVLANITDTVRLMTDDSYMNEVSTLERGGEVTVITEGWHIPDNTYFTVEYRNAQYRIWNDERENVNFRKTVSKDKPAEFNRDTPFDAIVTEDIGYNIPGNDWGRVHSIPAGETVTVKSGSGPYGQAEVSYNEHERIYIFWKYLKSAD